MAKALKWLGVLVLGILVGYGLRNIWGQSKNIWGQSKNSSLGRGAGLGFGPRLR